MTPGGPAAGGVVGTETVADARAEDPAGLDERRRAKEFVLRGMSRAERLIVILYYYEGMTMAEVGQVLDLSEGRISQMHGSILVRLRAQLSYPNLQAR